MIYNISVINTETRPMKNITVRIKKYKQEFLSKGPKYCDIKSDIILYIKFFIKNNIRYKQLKNFKSILINERS